mmetsp:Transcript_10954/g.16445  ORF Transcript_10954/g.16445 Transcript_10954/m.16445 type:complete len:1000 (+) Transcript_10954:41-3040(+)
MSSSSPLSFTSKYCPHAPGLKNSCELPFGLIWSPFQSCKQPSDTTSRSRTNAGGDEDNSTDAVLCLHCLAYMHSFVEIYLSKGLWKCSFCGASNCAPQKVLESVLVASRNNINENITMVEEVFHETITLSKEALTSATETEVKSPCYVFVIDNNIPADQVLAIRDGLKKILDEIGEGTENCDGSFTRSDVRLGLIVFDETVSVYQLGVRGIASADVFSGHGHPYEGYDGRADDSATDGENATTTTVQNIDGKNGNGASIRTKPQRFNHISSSTSLYFASFCGGDSCETFLQSITASCAGDQSVDLGGSSGPKSRKDLLRQRREARKTNKVKTAKTVKRQKRKMEMRCTGMAMKVAVDLAISSGSKTGRIFLFTSGMPSVGPGAMVDPFGPKCRTQRVDTSALIDSAEFFRTLGEVSAEAAIGVDVLCSGTQPVGLPAFQALTHPSAGYALLHNSFLAEEPQWQFNLKHLLVHTEMSPSWESVAHTVSPAVISNRPKKGYDFQHGCILDLKMSDSVSPVQIVGPGDEDAASSTTFAESKSRARKGRERAIPILPSERILFTEGATLAASFGLPTNRLPNPEFLSSPSLNCRFLVGRKDLMSTFSIMLEVGNRPDNEEYVYFQTISRWMQSARYNENYVYVTKVCTTRLPIAQNTMQFLSGLEAQTVAVVLSKEAVLRSATWVMGAFNIPLAGGELEVDIDEVEEEESLTAISRLDLDHTIQKISHAYRLLGQIQEANARNFSSLAYTFPPNLTAESFLRLMHHLRRGGMLGAGALLQTAPDDRHGMRDIFLRFPLDNCLAIMAPQMWRWRAREIQIDPLASSAGEPTTNSRVTLHPPVKNGLISSSKVPITIDTALPETLALWDDVVLAMDHYDNLLVWQGKSIPKDAEHIEEVMDCIRSYVLQRAQDRFPSPQIHYLREGDSMSRRLTARLAPSHKDPQEQQVALCPALASLSEIELDSLRNKFRWHDTTGDDVSFRRWFWDVASASAKLGTEGRSLCE